MDDVADVSQNIYSNTFLSITYRRNTEIFGQNVYVSFIGPVQLAAVL